MSKSAKLKKQKVTSVKDFISASSTTRTQEDTSAKSDTRTRIDATAFADIAENVFYKIMLDDSIQPEDKKAAVAKALTFTDDRTTARENLEAFNRFKEYLQFERKRMAQEIIALTDTEAFGELKSVFEEINTALLTFEERIGPLTDIVDAVYTLRMNGMTFDIFQELLKDREKEKERAEERKKAQQEIAGLEDKLKNLQINRAHLMNERSLFGLGPIKRSAQDQLVQVDADLETTRTDLSTVVDRLKELQAQQPDETAFKEFAAEKAKLKELLDITSEEHKVRQEQLVASAQDFINSTETRVSQVLTHFGSMNGQIDNLDEANFTMRSMYAVLNDATKDVNEANEQRRKEIKESIDKAGSDLEKLTHERLERDINAYISNLGRSNVDTTAVLAELTASGHRVQSMKDANEQQIAKTRQLHTSGVAGVADQLSTVLQAVSAAALGESSETAKISLERMNKTTSDLGQREVIRVALGTKEINQDLSAALAELSEYGETIKAATNITREGLSETKELLSKIERQTEQTQSAIKESMDVAADVTSGVGGARSGQGEARADGEGEAPAAEKSAPPNPFGLGKK